MDPTFGVKSKNDLTFLASYAFSCMASEVLWCKSIGQLESVFML